MIKKCPACGVWNDEDREECHRCRYKFTAIVEQQPGYSPQSSPAPPSNPKPNRSRTALLSFLFFLGLISSYVVLWEILPRHVWLDSYGNLLNFLFYLTWFIFFCLFCWSFVPSTDGGVIDVGQPSPQAPRFYHPRIIFQRLLALLLPGYLFFGIVSVLSHQIWELSVFYVFTFAAFLFGFFWAFVLPKGERNPPAQVQMAPEAPLPQWSTVRFGHLLQSRRSHRRSSFAPLFQNLDLVALPLFSSFLLFFYLTGTPVMWFLAAVFFSLVLYLIVCFVCCRELLVYQKQSILLCCVIPLSLFFGYGVWWFSTSYLLEGAGVLLAIALVPLAVVFRPGRYVRFLPYQIDVFLLCVPFLLLLVWGVLIWSLHPSWLPNIFKYSSSMQVPFVFNRNLNLGLHPPEIFVHEELWINGQLFGSQLRTVFAVGPNGVNKRNKVLEDGLKNAPSTFYHEQGPAQDLFSQIPGRKPRCWEEPGSDRIHLKPAHFGFLGLGTGDLSCYADDGDKVDFFESNQVLLASLELHSYSYLVEAKKRKVALTIYRGDPIREIWKLNNKYDILVLNLEPMKGIPFDLLTVWSKKSADLQGISFLRLLTNPCGRSRPTK